LPGDRHATARELADELDAAMSELGMAATHREVGAAVARLFADVRAETKRAIESKLGRASMATGMPAVTDTGETRAARPRAGRPRALVVMLGVAVGISPIAVGFWGGYVTKRAELTARGGVASPSIQAPAPAPATRPQTNLTAMSPDATARPEDHAPAAAEAK